MAELVFVSFAVARAAEAQPTLFYMPSADVLAPGSLHLEEDTLWRPGRPEESYLTIRAVVGLGDAVEGGVNLGGLVAEGRSMPTATLALKRQPLRNEHWTVTTGVHGQFFLRGNADGSPSGYAYVHAAWASGSSARTTAGVWYSRLGFADTRVTRGILAGLEQRLRSNLVAQAD